MEVTLHPIAVYHGPLASKFGVPRQSGLAKGIEGRVVFNDSYGVQEALRGLEGFSRIWIIWGFSLNGKEGWQPTVRPPRLGGNRSVGVWASRSPYRPNPLGLSCVEIVSIGKGEICVRGADLADGTPVYDIKPYIPYADSFPDAEPGFAASAPQQKLEVVFPADLPFTADQLDTLREVLSLDPRPAYQNDENRVYGFTYQGYDVRFSIKNGQVLVQGAHAGTGFEKPCNPCDKKQSTI